MKENLIEEIVRIKKMMNLNEEPVDLSTYDSDEDIIRKMEVLEKLPNGNVLIDMELNVFVPDNSRDNNKGTKRVIRVVTEWDKRYEITDVKSAEFIGGDVDKDFEGALIYNINHVFFKKHTNFQNIIRGIYSPYYLQDKIKRMRDNTAVIFAIKKRISELNAMLDDAFNDGDFPVKQKQVKKDPVVNKPQLEPAQKAASEPKNNGGWSSTNSWNIK